MSEKGLNLSQHNGTVNFDKVKADGYSFVILRIGYRGYGYGDIMKDTKFNEYYTLARRAGLKIGVYFFTQAINEKEAIEEAEWTIKQLGTLRLDYPVYIDQEWSTSPSRTGRADKNTVRANTDVCKGFCKRVEELGWYAGIYMSLSWLQTKVYYKELIQYDKWIAKWSLVKPTTAYGVYGMWQNSNNGSTSGARGRVDVNKAYYNYPQIMKDKGLNNYSRKVKYNIEIKNITQGDMFKVKELCDSLSLKEVTVTEV